jgi:hypothetical protein
MGLESKTLAISGPTYQNQRPFQWSKAYGNDPHQGLPDLYQFPWLLIDPLFLKN